MNGGAVMTTGRTVDILNENLQQEILQSMKWY
jgi:hypothetical protein